MERPNGLFALRALDRKMLILNSHARELPVAYPQASMTEHNEARPSLAKNPQQHRPVFM